jgi:hypothetical protein
MAGAGNRSSGSSRGAGGKTKGYLSWMKPGDRMRVPMRPSAARVEEYQQASREARSRNSTGVARAQDRIRQLQGPQAPMNRMLKAGTKVTPAQRTAAFRANNSQNRVNWGIAYRKGGLDVAGLAERNRGKRGYRAPATRLY